MMMNSARLRRGRGELLHEMGFSLVGCIRNLTLNVDFGNGSNTDAVISVQRKSTAEYDAAAFDDAELMERIEPDGQRSDLTVKLVDEGEGEGKKGDADFAARDSKEGYNLGRRAGTNQNMVSRGGSESGFVYEFAHKTEGASVKSCYTASEQNQRSTRMEKGHSIEIQLDQSPAVKETYFSSMQKHYPGDENSAPVAEQFSRRNLSNTNNEYSHLPYNGCREKAPFLGKPSREEQEFPNQTDYEMKEQHYNKSSDSVWETKHDKVDFSQKIANREFGTGKQISGDFQSRPATHGCFSCGNEGHMARDCPNKNTAECRICRKEGHSSRDCPARSSSKQCHNCGQEGHMSRDCPEKKTSMQCHNCGQEGHISRDCPEKKTSIQCRNCGQEGHMFRDCTEKKTSMQCRKCDQEGHMARDCTMKKAIQCHKCGQDGHISRDCTEKTSMQCRNCGQEGHMSRDCTEKKTTMLCYNCGQEGHVSRDCSQAKNPTSCYTCGQEGHISRDCPKKPPMDCRMCFQQGHMARDCPNSDGTEGAKGDRPPPYIPPPPPDDDEHIFETLLKGINFNKYDEIPVECTGRNAPSNSVNGFSEFGLSDVLQDNIRKSKYDKPTPIQKWAIPVILDGRDIMACAVTGSGKTAAFLLPILTKIIRNESVGSSDGVALPEALILSPTRELAIQIFHEIRKFAHDTMVSSAVVYGGVSSMYLFSQLNKGANIIVATPGRLLDLMQKGKISLSRVKHLVLDEADRMLDLGFLPDIRRIIDEHGMPVRTCRQTLMFSATFPDEMQMLAAEMLNDYIFITVGCVGGASEDIEQIVHRVSQSEKRQKLFEILQTENSRVVVFVELKRNADFLSNQLTQSQFPTASIHGDLNQKDREAGLADFRSGRAAVLVATSVAARGLDIPEVKHVINFDMPSSIEEYVHRIGRTGRCGNLGKATSFFDPDRDSSLTRALVKVLADAKQVLPDWLEEMATQSIGTGGFGGRGNGQFGARDNRRQSGRERGGRTTGEGDSALCEDVSPMQQDDTWND